MLRSGSQLLDHIVDKIAMTEEEENSDLDTEEVVKQLEKQLMNEEVEKKNDEKENVCDVCKNSVTKSCQQH